MKTKLNREIAREGAGLPRKEGQVVPYRTEEVEARKMQIGRYAYRPLAGFWANSTPVYAATLRPAAGVSLPFAVAMVNPARVEAAGLTLGKGVSAPRADHSGLGSLSRRTSRRSTSRSSSDNAGHPGYPQGALASLGTLECLEGIGLRNLSNPGQKVMGERHRAMGFARSLASIVPRS